MKTVGTITPCYGNAMGIAISANAMHNVRPYEIFTLLDLPPSERCAQVQIPARRGAGGVSLLETFLIVTVARVVAARRVFEFGTFLGSTTLNLALNTADDAEILTLDLDEYSAVGAARHDADAALTRTHLSSRSALDFLGSPVCAKIKTLTGNSRTFDFSPWTRSVDLVFIDGGHDAATAKSDTENAFAMLARDKESCVLWHDYQNPDYASLTDYLDSLSRQVQIFRIEDTALCAYFNDPAGSVSSHLCGKEEESAADSGKGLGTDGALERRP